MQKIDTNFSNSIDIYRFMAEIRLHRILAKFVGYLDIDPTQCHPNYTADIREGVAVEYVSCEPTENLREFFPEVYGEGDDSFEEEETEQA